MWNFCPLELVKIQLMELVGLSEFYCKSNIGRNHESFQIIPNLYLDTSGLGGLGQQ